MRRWRCALPIVVAALVGGAATCVTVSPLRALNAFAPGDFQVTHDIAYGPGPRELLDIYAPRHATGAPVVVFFYGGSWQWGSRAIYRFVGAALASHGVVTVIPDYRVYPETVFPGFLADAAAAVSWAHAHAVRFGGDPDRLFLMGHSAGAYIAAMLTLDPTWLAQQHMQPGRDIAGLIGLAGPYDFLPLTDPVLQRIFGPPAGLARTQPINAVRPGAPPVFLAAGEKDRTVDPRNSIRLAVRLTNAGDAVTLRLYPGLDHRTLLGSLSPWLNLLGPVLPDCLAFIRHTRPKPQRNAA